MLIFKEILQVKNKKQEVKISCTKYKRLINQLINRPHKIFNKSI